LLSAFPHSSAFSEVTSNAHWSRFGVVFPFFICFPSIMSKCQKKERTNNSSVPTTLLLPPTPPNLVLKTSFKYQQYLVTANETPNHHPNLIIRDKYMYEYFVSPPCSFQRPSCNTISIFLSLPWSNYRKQQTLN
jgi:hypothetical protein